MPSQMESTIELIEDSASVEVVVEAAHAGPPAKCGDPRATHPLFRAWHPIATDHFYTANPAEMKDAISKLGYADEGVTGYIFINQQPSTVPLFRLFHLPQHNHFYTTDAKERDNAIALLGYVDEGIVGYIYPNAECGGLALYRSFNSAGSDHFYTMSESEKNNAQGGGWGFEGITGYVFPF
ncbi:hypothetical protein C0991_002287 [Blastosporella zonata]|nr:hypothetical protein C0991_002287 [Blastosporella zonata]